MISLVLAVATLLVAAAGDAQVRQIRLCADPSNPPFSSQDAGEPGFEVEIARAIAAALGAELSVHWVPTVREIVALRQLYEGRCDLLMGLPLTSRFADDKPRLAFTAPYYVMRHVAVSATVGGASLDTLQGRLFGVQAMTLADQLVYERGWRRKVYVTPDDVFAALMRSDVDTAVVESTFAGPFLKKHPGFQALVLEDPQRDFAIGAAVRKTDADLKDAIDRALDQLRARAVPDILARYGVLLAQAAPSPTPPTASPAPPVAPELRYARSTYLTQCSQCHGTDARGTPAAANLKAFKGSEDDFLRIVRNGRPGTAMTPWRGLIDDDDIRNIARYIKGL